MPARLSRKQLFDSADIIEREIAGLCHNLSKISTPLQTHGNAGNDRSYRRLLDASSLPRSEALALLGCASGLRREALLAASEVVPADEVIARFAGLERRRVDGEPLAYLVGFRDFYGRRFAVDRTTLIPREDTEVLVEFALARVRSRRIDAPLAVLDLGTGSGVIAITLALESDDCRVFASDVSSAALRVARRNADRLGATVTWCEGSWFDALAFAPADRFDLIVANPPYIAVGDAHLDLGDLRFEPMIALASGTDGLDAIRCIARAAPAHLATGGCLAIEHGHDQAIAVRHLLDECGFVDIDSVRDLAGIERVTFGTLPRREDP